MPLAIEITVDLLWLPFICIVFALAGFIFRSAQLGKLRRRVAELEKEMVQNHAEILSLQKENAVLQDTMKNNTVPVIPITSKENTTDPLQDPNRNKLMGKSGGKKS